MKKLIVFIFVFAFVLFCKVSTVNAINFELEISGPNELNVGQSIQLKSEYWVAHDMPGPEAPIGEISRENVTKKVTWKSSDPEIAIVDKTGKVTGKKSGVTTIRAKYKTGDYTENANYGITVANKNSSNSNTENVNKNIFESKFSLIKIALLAVIVLLFLIIMVIVILTLKQNSKKEN